MCGMVCVCLYVCACACGWVGRYSKRVTHLVARSSVFSRMRFSSSLPIPATGHTQYESFPANAIPLLQSLLLLFSQPKLQALAPQDPFSMKAGVVITLTGVQNGPGPLSVPQVRHNAHIPCINLQPTYQYRLQSQLLLVTSRSQKTQARVGYLLELEARRARTGYHVTNSDRDVRLDSLAVTT